MTTFWIRLSMLHFTYLEYNIETHLLILILDQVMTVL